MGAMDGNQHLTQNKTPMRTGAALVPTPHVIPSYVVPSVASRLSHRYKDPCDQTAARLLNAALGSDQEIAVTLREMRTAGITDEQVVDIYVPAAVRLIGSDWCENKCSFVSVTIASIRLTAVVRQLSQQWYCDDCHLTDAPCILLALPEVEQHALGIQIVTSKMRRLGASVKLITGTFDSEIGAHLRTNTYDLIAVSISREDGLEIARDLVKTLKKVVGTATPVGVGGPAVANAEVLRIFTHADFYAASPEELLKLCVTTKTYHTPVNLSEST